MTQVEDHVAMMIRDSYITGPLYSMNVGRQATQWRVPESSQGEYHCLYLSAIMNIVGHSGF